ncbi:hypothetical protein NEAUS04_2084 [Nematocida ausubeli]|nr:hypothetical protein NEAUS04_2084 [Nematocida ausubeli]
MIYPETDILVMWRVFNKISLVLFAANILYFIDRTWGTLNYMEYVSILYAALVLVWERIFSTQRKTARIFQIYLLHILFISPLLHHLLYRAVYMVYFGIILSAFSFLFSSHKTLRQGAGISAGLMLSSRIERIECASGFNIAFILLQLGINELPLVSANVYALRAISLALNILSSNISVFVTPREMALWELFCTLIAPAVVTVLYQEKCKIRAQRAKRQIPRQKKLLIFQDTN